MGIFESLVGSYYKMGAERKLAAKAYSTRNTQYAMAIADSKRQQAFMTDIEHPRQQAALKQGMFGRGLGKSTIHDQDKGRLTTMQENREKTMRERIALLYKQKSLNKHVWQTQRHRMYADVAATVLDSFISAYFGGAVNQPQNGSRAGSGADAFSGPDPYYGGGPSYEGGQYYT